MQDFDPILLEPIGLYLKQKGESIAVAESVTTGLLQFAMGTIAEASLIYQGGVTAYNLGQKFKHLQVEPIHANATNCVSERVSKEMAINVCTLFNSNWGIGITGYASPVPQSDNKVYAYFSIAYEGKIVLTKFLDPEPSAPADLQRQFVSTVLDELLRIFKEKASAG